MSPTTGRITKSILMALVAAAVMAPGATALPENYQSPAALDPAAVQDKNYVDLRSPDARDSGVTHPSVTAEPASSSGSSGTDWSTIAFIAGGTMLLVVTGSALFMRRRRITVPKSPIAPISH